VFAVVYSFNILNSILNKFFKISFFNNNKNILIKKNFSNITYKNLFLLDSENVKNLAIFFSIYKNNFNFSSLLYYFVSQKYIFNKKYLCTNNLTYKFENQTNKTLLFSLEKTNFINFENNQIKFVEVFKNVNNIFNTLIIINKNYKFNFNLISQYKIKYSVSDVFKTLNATTLNYMNILFLRKNKVFNKGRYSRNRQNYRTGVY